MKHIILAIDSFKGCLSSVEAEDAAEHGLRELWQDVKIVKGSCHGWRRWNVECLFTFIRL